MAFTPGGGREFVMNYLWIAILLPIVFLMPNTQQIMARFQPALDHGGGTASTRLTWKPGWRWGAIMTLTLAGGLLSLTRPSEFMYFQF